MTSVIGVTVFALGVCSKKTLGSTLVVENISTTCDIVNTRCDGVNPFDFKNKGCPSYNYQNQRIPMGRTLRHHQEVGKYAANCPWTLHFKFSCGHWSVVRGHQKRVFKGHKCTRGTSRDCFRVISTVGHYITSRIDYKHNDYIVRVSDYKDHVEFMKSKKKEDEAKDCLSADLNLILNCDKNARAERCMTNLYEAKNLAESSLKHAKASKNKSRIQTVEFLCGTINRRIKALRELPEYTKRFQEELARLKERKADTKQQVDVIISKIDGIVSRMKSRGDFHVDQNLPVDETFVKVRESAMAFQKYVYHKSMILNAEELIHLGDLDKAEYELLMASEYNGSNAEIERLQQKIKDLRKDREAENLRQTGIGYTKALRFVQARTVLYGALNTAVNLDLKRQIVSDIQSSFDCEAECIKNDALKLAKQNQFDKALSKLEETSKLTISNLKGKSIQEARMKILSDKITWMCKQGDELVTKFQFDEAYNWFNSALPVPCHPNDKKKVYSSQANAYWAHAKYFVDQDAFQEAHEKFDMALKVQNEQLKVENTIVQITNDKAAAYTKEAKIYFKEACVMEDRVDQHEEMCKASQELFDKAKELFKSAHNLNASKVNSNNLGMCNAKIDGNNSYNSGTDLEVEGIGLFQNAQTKGEFQSAQKKLLGASDKFQEAKKLFKEGSKLGEKNLFKSSIDSTKEAMKITKEILRGISVKLLKLGDTKLNTMLENEKNMAGTSKTEKEYIQIVDTA